MVPVLILRISFEGSQRYGPADHSLHSNVGPGTFRMFRGGDWYYNAQYCRSAARFYYSPDCEHFIFGFRPVRSAN